MRRLAASLACLVVAAAAAAPQAGADALVALPASTPASVTSIPGLELTGDPSTQGLMAIASDSAITALHALGVEPRIAVADLAVQDRADRAADRAYTARQGTAGSGLPTGRTEYRHLADYDTDLARLVREHPGLVKPIELDPPSLQGRHIHGVEITHDVDARDGKPVFLQLGLHHAREWPSGESAIEFAFDLAQSDGHDPRITALLDRVRVIVIPVVNPDGFVASRESPIDPQDPITTQPIGIVQNATAYRRKNCRITGNGGFTQPPVDCDTALGVDLNRNYGIGWGGSGASSFDEAPDYRGVGPFSEPEVEAIRRLIKTRQVTMLLTNHTSGDLVLRPPGVKALGVPPDEDALRELGARFAAQNGYVNQRSYELYDNSGTTEDWSYGVTGGFGYTFEIGNENFHPAYERAVVGEYLGTGAYAGKGNREAYLIAMETAADRADHAVLEGFAPPGRVLRVRRTVTSMTSPVCIAQPTGFFSTPCGPTTAPLPFSDDLDSTRVVGADGAIDWDLNPSHAPLSKDDGHWQLTCEDEKGTVLERRSIDLVRGGRLSLDLTCGAAPCRAARALQETVVVAPSHGGRSVRVATRLRAGVAAGTPISVQVLRVARGRATVTATTVLRTRLEQGELVLPASRFSPGAYEVRLSAAARAGGRDVRRRGFQVSAAGRVQHGPRFARTDGCRELRTARLASPVFGGTGDRAPSVIVRLPGSGTISGRIVRAGKTVAMLKPTPVAGGRDVRVPLPGAHLAAGAYDVRVTTTRGPAAAQRVSRVTLHARAI